MSYREHAPGGDCGSPGRVVPGGCTENGRNGRCSSTAYKTGVRRLRQDGGP